MRRRVSSHAALRSAPHARWLAGAAAGALMLAAFGAHGQAQPGGSNAGAAATSPSVPADIQPGHPAPATTGSRGSSGAQSATPAPLPPSAGADTPGGTSRDGVIKPPVVTGDQEINKGAPKTEGLGSPVVPPPGSPGGNTKVVPK